MSDKRFQSFDQFYPFYLSEHSDRRCRALHYTGSLLVLACLGYLIASGNWQWVWLLPVIGYGFAWIGHFGFEHNRPATFQYPLYSFLADWVMLKDWMTGQLDAKLASALEGKP